IIQYSGNAIKSDDPAQSKVVGKLDFGVVPKQEAAIAQIGIFIHGVSASAPNKDNAIAFMKWFATNDVQTALARSGDLPVKTPAFSDAQAVKDHRLLPVALAQLNAGAQARPRTPDWSKVESIIGTELNIALAAGSGGGAALLTAARFVFLVVTIETVLGLALALLVSREGRFIRRIRATLILPMIITPVVVGIVFRLIYASDVGLLASIAHAVGLDPPQILSSGTGAFWGRVV